MNAETDKDCGSTLANLKRLLPDLESVYKDLHSHPELSMQENRTARIAADHLRAAGYDYRSREDRRCGLVAKRRWANSYAAR